MSNLTTALVFVMALNVIMMLSQVAILDINPDATMFFTQEETILSQFDKNKGVGDPILDTNGTVGRLPSSVGSVSATTGNLFTDTFTSIKTWIGQKTGLTYLFAIVSAPYNFLKAIHLPNAFSFAIGTLWYAVTLFLLISFIFGRD